MSESLVREWTIPVGEGWIKIVMSAPTDQSAHTGEHLEQTAVALAAIARTITRERIKLQRKRGKK